MMENEEIWRRLVEGIRTYCRENNFARVMLGLSGGLDSAITAVLAAEALGGEKVDAFMLKTRYTSDLSLQIARETARLNGLNFREIDIDGQVEQSLLFLTDAFGESLKPVVKENLQARERGKFLMAYSNQSGALLLACGNKSEILTGYCTLYGDTCGGLAPIGNVYKSDLFALARWRNRKSRVLPPEVIARAPSAELSAGQKDEDSLPAYDVLDPVLRLLADEKLPAEEIVAKGRSRELVDRVAKLVEKSAFKRRQLPPAIDF